MRGQMGQPAACMIENKWNLRSGFGPCNYVPRVWRVASLHLPSFTESVHNFVKNKHVKWVIVALAMACNTMVLEQAEEN